MEQQLMALESGSSDSELLDGIFRVVHTIKGNASALDFPELAGFAHVIEDFSIWCATIKWRSSPP